MVCEWSSKLPGDLTIDAPIQNRGGNGWIFLFSGGKLVINDSLPEPQAEISVENEGAVRGYAQGDVVIDNTATDYVIVRTHAERFPVTGTLPTLTRDGPIGEYASFRPDRTTDHSPSLTRLGRMWPWWLGQGSAGRVAPPLL